MNTNTQWPQLQTLLDPQLKALALNDITSQPWADPHKQDPLWAYAQDPAFSVLPDGFFAVLFYVRNLNKWLFENIENNGNVCVQKSWDSSHRASSSQDNHPRLNGGGTMTVMRGDHIEKAAVNMSVVHGPCYPAIEGEYAGKPFVAAGVSLICHTRNPHAPIMHMNIRCLSVEKNPGENVSWMGGGADLTPMLPQDQDTQLFHQAMRMACENSPHVADYPKFYQWAKDYFYIPHRRQERGVGGIFFDYLPLKNFSDVQLLLDVGQYAAQAYHTLLNRRIHTPYDAALEQEFLFWRGRYAEFNLAYDRGTRFGLVSGGNAEAILCSMPPRVSW